MQTGPVADIARKTGDMQNLQSSHGCLLHSMLQVPAIRTLVPQMWGAELVHRFPELRIGHAYIVKEIRIVTLWEFLIIFTDQMNSFLTGDLVVSHLLSRIIGRPANTKFDQRGEIVEHVDLVVDARIF